MPLSPAEIVRAMEVPDEGGVFVLGCFDKRITILSQQTRALNLAYALCETGRLAYGDAVAIVGGGVAGLTCAAALLRRGMYVALLERTSRMLHMQAQNDTRFLHPHLYEWPRAGWHDRRARVPLLGWQADRVSGVVQQLRLQWRDLERRYTAAGRLIVRAPRPGAKLDAGAGPAAFRWSVLYRPPPSPFRAVVLAVGFGRERGQPGVRAKSYWENDHLDQEHAPPARLLISGSGDGGLVDVLRARVFEFQVDRVIDDFLPDGASWVNALGDELLAIEDDARAHDPTWLTERYLALDTPALDEALAIRLRNDTQVVWHTRSPAFLSRDSFVLNRVLVARLKAVDPALQLDHTPLPPERPIAIGERVRFGAHEFDHVYLRHGPDSELCKDFRWVVQRAVHHFDQVALEDRTREPLDWPPGYFDETQPDAPAEPTPRRDPTPTEAPRAPRWAPDVFCELYDELERHAGELERIDPTERRAPLARDVAVVRAAHGFVPAALGEFHAPLELLDALYLCRVIDAALDGWEALAPNSPLRARLERDGSLADARYGLLLPAQRLAPPAPGAIGAWFPRLRRVAGGQVRYARAAGRAPRLDRMRVAWIGGDDPVAELAHADAEDAQLALVAARDASAADAIAAWLAVQPPVPTGVRLVAIAIGDGPRVRVLDRGGSIAFDCAPGEPLALVDTPWFGRLALVRGACESGAADLALRTGGEILLAFPHARALDSGDAETFARGARIQTLACAPRDYAFAGLAGIKRIERNKLISLIEQTPSRDT
jgi:FAD dependent oxidoreductase